MPTSTIAPSESAASLARRALRVRRGALCLGALALTALISGLVTSGFGRPALFVGAVLGAVSSLAAVIETARLVRRALQLAGLPQGSGLRAVLHPREERSAGVPVPVGVGLLLLGVAGVVLAGVLSGVVLAARTLGDPQRAVASSAAAAGDCTRCHSRAEATFTTSAGRRVTAELAAPLQGASSYAAGITVVYDESDPTRAMAADDYRLGRSAGVTVLLVAGLLMPSAAVTLGGLLAGRRREA